MDFITTNDGASYTLMVSENLQAGNWATDPTVTTPGAAPNPPYQSDFQLRQNTTFVWYVNGMYNNAEATPPPYPGVKINALARTATTPLVYPITMMNNDGLGYSRPSSAHPGGVNVMFCDGHNRFISEDIQYNVYTQLMTPRQNAIQITAAGATPSTVMPPWNYLISETDY